MLDSPGTPYPPARNTWEFAALRPSRRRRLIGVLAALVSLAAAAGLVAALGVVAQPDSARFVDDAALADTIATECLLMTLTVDSMPLSGGTPEQARTLADQNRAIALMLRSIRSDRADVIRADPPVGRWLRDWKRLVDARAAYARELRRDPRATLVLPTVDGGSDFADRMDDVWRGTSRCRVPRSLIQPHTDAYSAV